MVVSGGLNPSAACYQLGLVPAGRVLSGGIGPLRCRDVPTRSFTGTTVGFCQLLVYQIREDTVSQSLVLTQVKTV